MIKDYTSDMRRLMLEIMMTYLFTRKIMIKCIVTYAPKDDNKAPKKLALFFSTTRLIHK